MPEYEKEVEKLMEYNQPLGNFSNKITITYCLGLIDKVVKDDLTLVRKIRNKFAHDLLASFEDEQIKSWCIKLKWYKISMMRNPPADATTRDLFQVSVNQLIIYLNGYISVARGQKRVLRNNF
jgi:DNA-binding MltR family transcriptional regulator